jgi:cobalamin biosynthesis protein CobT
MARPQSKKIKKNLLNQTMKAKLKRIIGGSQNERNVNTKPNEEIEEEKKEEQTKEQETKEEKEEKKQESANKEQSEDTQKHMSDEEIDKSFGGEENTDALSFWLKKAQDLLLNPKITQEMIYDSIEPMRLGSMSNTPFLREQLREMYQLIRILRILEYNIQNPQYN